MRIRKIPTVIAVSVALVLVARTIESRRHAELGSFPEPEEPVAVEVPAEIEQPAAVEIPAEIEQPVAVEVPAEIQEPQEPAEAGRRLGRPLAALAMVVVLAAALAGTLLAVSGG